MAWQWDYSLIFSFVKITEGISVSGDRSRIVSISKSSVVARSLVLQMQSFVLSTTQKTLITRNENRIWEPIWCACSNKWKQFIKSCSMRVYTARFNFFSTSNKFFVYVKWQINHRLAPIHVFFDSFYVLSKCLCRACRKLRLATTFTKKCNLLIPFSEMKRIKCCTPKVNTKFFFKLTTHMRGRTHLCGLPKYKLGNYSLSSAK